MEENWLASDLKYFPIIYNILLASVRWLLVENICPFIVSERLRVTLHFYSSAWLKFCSRCETLDLLGGDRELIECWLLYCWSSLVRSVFLSSLISSRSRPPWTQLCIYETSNAVRCSYNINIQIISSSARLKSVNMWPCSWDKDSFNIYLQFYMSDQICHPSHVTEADI